MKIILDGMGGDNAPFEIVKGAVETSKKIEHEICIVGDREKIEAELQKLSYDPEKISVLHASEIIEAEESPVKAIRRKKDSSMVVGINEVKEGRGDVFISAGNSGAIMAGGLFILGRVEGIDRPALAATYPILGKGVTLLIDTGANSECRSRNLIEFAFMGSIYMEKVLGVSDPRVGLVNMGTEENKGTATLKETFGLLKMSREKGYLNFIGNVEGRDVPKGVCDVIVCDGMVGNVILKLTEGLAWQILKLLKAKFTDGLRAKIGAAFLLNKMNELKTEFDYSEYGGAPILGVKGPLIKIHGSSSAKAVRSSIEKCIPFVENNVVDTIGKYVNELDELRLEAEKDIND